MPAKIIEPQREDVLLDRDVIVTQPLFAQRKQLAQLFGISKTSVYRIVKEWEQDDKGVKDMYVELSPTLRLISIEAFKQYLFKRNKDYLYKA
ncbi:helix-turn-helix domain-containing protein [Macrococcus equi]|uniref:helix-turn-helix domain-containing protein n=1 Tax=Macrococcus equi TaxID=3395462 RepID=UPI0039BE5A7B